MIEKKREKSETNDYNIARVEYKQGNKVPLMLLLAGCMGCFKSHLLITAFLHFTNTYIHITFFSFPCPLPVLGYPCPSLWRLQKIQRQLYGKYVPTPPPLMPVTRALHTHTLSLGWAISNHGWTSNS